MAKRGSKMKTSTKVLIGAGATAAVGGLGYFLYRQYQQAAPPEPEEDVNTDAVDDNVYLMPERRESFVADKIVGARTAASRATPGSRAGGGTLAIFMNLPAARLLYDPDGPWNGTSLPRYHKVGKMFGYVKYLKFVWHNGDGTVTAMSASAGHVHYGPDVHLTSALNVPKGVYIKKIVPGEDPLPKKVPDELEKYLQNPAHGFRFVPVQTDFSPANTAGNPHLWLAYNMMPRTVVVTVPAGDYVVVANPMNNHFGSDGVPNGYYTTFKCARRWWEWTSDTARPKSCGTVAKMCFDGNCSGDMTSFKRLHSVTSWDDVSDVVTVTSGKTSQLQMSPKFDLTLSNFKRKHDGTQAAACNICKTAQEIIGWADWSEAVFDWLLKKIKPIADKHCT